MVEVYTNGVLEITDNASNVAKHIGISRSTIYGMNRGEIYFLPEHAKCDYIIVRGYKHIKKPPTLTKNQARQVEIKIGLIITINEDVRYKLTNIETFGSNTIYTYNHHLKVRAREPYKSYGSAYKALTRAIEDVL